MKYIVEDGSQSFQETCYVNILKTVWIITNNNEEHKICSDNCYTLSIDFRFNFEFRFKCKYELNCLLFKFLFTSNDTKTFSLIV